MIHQMFIYGSAAPAFVSPVTFNFNAQGADALTAGVPIAVSPITQDLISVTNAWIGHPDIADPVYYEPERPGAVDGYVLNRNRGGPASVITIQLDASLIAASRFIQSISVRVATNAPSGAATFSRFNAGGLVGIDNFSPGSILMLWNTPRFPTSGDYTVGNAIQKIEIAAPLYVIAIDDLVITLTP